MPKDERLPESHYPLPPKSGCMVLTPQVRQHEAAKIAAPWHRNHRKAQSVAEMRSKASTRCVYYVLFLPLSEVSLLFAARSLVIGANSQALCEPNVQESRRLYLGLVC